MAQYARPGSDVAAGSWTATPLYAKIDEASYDDADFISGPSRASSTCQIGLSSVTDPVSSSNHVLRVRAYLSNTGLTLTFALYCGTTLIKSWDPGVTTGSFAPYSVTLTSGEADSITNYGDLRLHCIQTYSSGTGTRRAYVSWAEFEVPDVAPTTVTLGVTTVAASPQTVTTSTTPAPTTVSLNVATLSVTLNKLSPVLPLKSVTLVASPQAISIDAGAIPPTTVILNVATITTSVGIALHKGIILELHHAAGDLSEYSSFSPNNTQFSSTAGSALGGTNYGLAVSFAGDTTDRYGEATTLSNYGNRLRFRFYVDPNSFAASVDDNLIICTFWNSIDQYITNVGIGKSGSNYQMRATATSNVPADINTNWFTISDGPHVVEVDLFRSDSGQSNGSLTLYIDGSPKQTLSGIANDTRWTNITKFRVGYWNTLATTTGTYFFDELIVNNTGLEIGALPTTVSLNVASTIAAAQTLTIVPGAVTTIIGVTNLQAQSQIITIDAGAPQSVIVNLNVSTTVASAQTIVIDAPFPALTINLSSAVLNTNSQNAPIIPGAISINLVTTALTASSQILTLVPGQAYVNISSANITSGGQLSTVIPGAVTTNLVSSIVTAISQLLTVLPGEAYVDISSANISSTPQSSSVIPGAATIVISSASLLSLAQLISIFTGSVPLTVGLNVANLYSNAQIATLVPGAITITFNVANISSSVDDITVLPGTVSIAINSATLLADPIQLVELPGEVSVTLNVTELLAAIQNISIISGSTPQTITLGSVNLNALSQNATVLPGSVVITINTANITGYPQTVTLSLGEIPLTVLLNPAPIGTTAQIITVLPGEVITQLVVAALSALAQISTILPGAIVAQLDSVELIVSPQTITISAPFLSLIIDLNSAGIQIETQTLSVIPGDVQVQLLTSLLYTLAQRLNLIYGTPLDLTKITISISNPVYNITESGGFSVSANENNFTAIADETNNEIISESEPIIAETDRGSVTIISDIDLTNIDISN